MTEEVLVENMFDTMIQYPSSPIASDITGEQTIDQNERDESTGDIGTGRGTSAPEPMPIGVDAEWINFIFGDGDDEVQEIAFQEARKEAARDLRPSSVSGNSCCQTTGSDDVDYDTTTAATYATSNGDYEKDGSMSSPPSRSSSGSGLGHTSIRGFGDVANAPLKTYNHMNTHTDVADSTIVEVAESIAEGVRSGCHTTDMPSTPELDSASTAAQPPESEVGEVPGQSFQFARPKTFVGRLASSLVQDAGPIVPLSVHNEAGKSGRPRRRSRKKAKDGRADIRRVPDHDGDPIEGGSDE
ncbi:hypothetical protein LX36DRAFT_696975 [Colletotrichum falcatum]|nr:hypothetical protein LX36DRAFT_696975 [Colletotrichum falcatum]